MAMKTQIFHRLLFIFSFALVPPTASGEEIDPVLKEIRGHYAEIEKSELRSETVKFESETERASGTCTLGFQGDELVKVKLSYEMGDHGGTDEYFYYRKGALIFAFAIDSSWKFGGKALPDGGAGTIDTVVEHRAYFENGKLIRHLAKEASSADAKAIPALLEKAPNQVLKDTERAKLLQRYGNRAFQVRTTADLGKLLLESE